ncbi:right-handed parallel beta-helix repeat-containing protein [Streptomyces sp. DSM 40750]|uniref:right-handed parallel beta-helix repeat-containing protein n=1 Tax=Streptomyces sp. DSM 40750 TaxID=2801030 RepID=UPI00214B6934|nr:right-handed parallel beta-helix repeat-containing protein [Streptomyces sp. DSM 40750]UUU20313.1 right-handed parallel beta-helix repeat-containing protein [Streptomyces sp. DSM 40750]
MAVPAALTGVLVAGCAAGIPHYTPGQSYYLSPDGDDDNDGRSPGQAWRSLERADERAFAPGDRLLLRGGARFPGSLKLSEGEAGREDTPVVVGSYGGGRATIVADDAPGITVHNTAGVEIRGVAIAGRNGAYNDQGGIHAYSDRADAKKLRYLSVDGVEISGFRTGIQIGSASRSTGFREVRITDSVLRNNKDNGLLTYGPMTYEEVPTGYSHEDVVVSGVEARHNAGDPRADNRHTGNGIVFGSVRGGRVQGSTAHDNGTRASARAPEGPIGIWAYDSTDLVMEHNSSYRNHTGSHVDGAGFGLDSNVSYSTAQYNLAFGNDGPGFHAYTGKTNDAHTGNVFRFNISSNDGRKWPDRGGIHVHGKLMYGLQVYNNTVVMTDTVRPGSVVRVDAESRHITFRNNILVTDGPQLVRADKAFSTDQALWQGNDYYTTADRWTVQWGGKTYSGLAQWRSATGQEMTNGRKTGFEADPCFRGGATPVVKKASDAALLVPVCDTLADKGLDLGSLVGTDMGSRDYFGKELGRTLPVGAVLSETDGPSPADGRAS